MGEILDCWRWDFFVRVNMYIPIIVTRMSGALNSSVSKEFTCFFF